MNSIKGIINACCGFVGLKITRLSSRPNDGVNQRTSDFDKLYYKYKDKTMLGQSEYVRNLALCSRVTTPGCVIECGVWKGGTSAGMAEVLGADREYFLFDSFQGHVDPL